MNIPDIYPIITTKQQFESPTHDSRNANAIDLPVYATKIKLDADNYDVMHTNCYLDPGFTGMISGIIRLEQETIPYSGTVELYTENNFLLGTLDSTDGSFAFYNLNPDLLYNVVCIPLDDTLYSSKIIKGYSPNIKEDSNIRFELFSQSYSSGVYSAIFKIYNLFGLVDVNVTGSYSMTVTEISDRVYKIVGDVPSAPFSYTLNVFDTVDSVTRSFNALYNYA